MGPRRRDQPYVPAGRGRAADRRQERRWRHADAVWRFAGRAISQDRAERHERGAQGACCPAQRDRTAEEGPGPLNGPAKRKTAAEAAIFRLISPKSHAVLIQTALTLRYSSTCCLPDSRP